MDPIVNLEEIATGGNDLFSTDSVMGNTTQVLSAVMGTNDEKNLIQDQNIDFKTRIKRHTEKENEISISVQVRREKAGSAEGIALKNSPESFPVLGNSNDKKRHLTEEVKNESFVAYNVETFRIPLKPVPVEDGSPKISSKGAFGLEIKKEYQSSPQTVVEELKKQNKYLVGALMKIQKTHSVEKRRFNEILFGIDKALSSLPIRLEKIRVRNQRNLSIINCSRFNSGDGSESPTAQSASEVPPSRDSRDSSTYVSSRMQCLLEKIDQLNELAKKLQDGESPIELLVNSELYAISLLKKEIKSTKKQIDEKKSDTDTVTSFDESPRDLAEDSSSKANNSFSNELNKASNFKIFENHMMLQEEALDLLTRKIKETEEALLKEIEAKEALKRENEAMAKEIFRLKSTEEESKGGKSQKMEKLKAEVEATGSRPYRLIKELRTKLEEKEKSLIAWKSKCSRLEGASANKGLLLESEKKKNSELEAVLKEVKAKSKSMSLRLSSLHCLNDQLKNQVEILQQQVKILANEKLERDVDEANRNAKLSELNRALKAQEEKMNKREEEVEAAMQEIRNFYESKLEEMKLKVKHREEKNKEFETTIKELLILLTTFGVEKDARHITNPSYTKIREILNMSPSDYELLFKVYSKSAIEKEVEFLHQTFQTLAGGEKNQFSESLSTWLFQIIAEKLLDGGSGEK